MHSRVCIKQQKRADGLMHSAPRNIDNSFEQRIYRGIYTWVARADAAIKFPLNRQIERVENLTGIAPIERIPRGIAARARFFDVVVL